MIARFLLRLIVWLEKLHSWTEHFSSNSRLRFFSTFGSYWISNPVEAAKKSTAPWFKAMVERAKAEKGTVKFVRCPGMFDYYQEGYIIRAHTDIHIRANELGVQVNMPGLRDNEGQPQPMDWDLVDGMAPIRDNVKRVVMKVPLPYGIHTEPGHSAHLIPALMHSPFLKDLFVYPGTVDYDTFHVANFIFSPLCECDLTIPAGTPLLHVLPFKRVSYHSACGPAETLETARFKFSFVSRLPAFYRKKFHTKKIYTSEVTK